MKKVIGVVMLLVFTVVGVAQPAEFRVEGIGSVTIPVLVNKMTNLIFPEPILIAVKVSRDLMAQKVRGVSNVLEIKAAREGMAETNLSVYGMDGRVYSFIVRLATDTAVLNYRVSALSGSSGRDTERLIRISALPADEVELQRMATQLDERRGFLKKRVKTFGLVLQLKGIYLADSLEWLTLRLNNRTRIPFRPMVIRYYLQDRKVVRRRASQEEGLEPVFTEPVPVLAGLDSRRYSVGFKPFTVPEGKRLVVALSGEDGGRLVVLKLPSRVVLCAR